MSFPQFSVVVGCRANYTFFQTYHSYLNPLSNRGDTGQCCDNQRMPPCSTLCDNIFTICVLQSGEELPSSDSDIQPEQCPLGFLRSQTISNRDNITFNTSAPVIFTGDVWPVSWLERPKCSVLLLSWSVCLYVCTGLICAGSAGV